LSRVVAKQATTTKVKTDLLVEKNSSKEPSVVFLVEGEKFNVDEIAELVLFGFFCPQPWFVRRSEHSLPGKTPAFSC